MADYVDIDVEGIDKLDFYLERLPDRMRRRMKDKLKDIARVAEYWLRIFAPIQYGPDGGGLQRRIDTSDLEFRPGGAGGGGWWTITVGVRRGDPYPLYVHGGTGIWGPSGRPIFSTRPGGTLRFEKLGEPPIFRKFVRGQEPNPFAERAFDATKPYARAQIVQLGDGVI